VQDDAEFDRDERQGGIVMTSEGERTVVGISVRMRVAGPDQPLHARPDRNNEIQAPGGYGAVRMLDIILQEMEAIESEP